MERTVTPLKLKKISQKCGSGCNKTRQDKCAKTLEEKYAEIWQDIDDETWQDKCAETWQVIDTKTVQDKATKTLQGRGAQTCQAKSAKTGQEKDDKRKEIKENHFLADLEREVKLLVEEIGGIEIGNKSPSPNEQSDRLRKQFVMVLNESNSCWLDAILVSYSDLDREFKLLVEEIGGIDFVLATKSSSPNEHGDRSCKKFVMWLNENNSCWLDATLALIAHNETLRGLICSNRSSIINEIIRVYSKATSTINDATYLFKTALFEMRQKSFDGAHKLQNLLFRSSPGKEKEKLSVVREKHDKLISVISEYLETRIQDTRAKLSEARKKLNKVRKNVLQYLQPRLKCCKLTREPHTAFCSLLNGITEDDFYRQHFEARWLWIKKCSNCDASDSCNRVKPIVTIPKVNKFRPEEPTCLYQCDCSEIDREMTLTYIEIPPCLIFHFENGAGKDSILTLTFSFEDIQFRLTGVVTREKVEDSNIDHFITWIRDPVGEAWLQCNDLIQNLITFSPEFPDFRMKDIYMMVYESDNVDKVTIDALAYDEIEVSNKD